jgi:hypothetical protein
MSGGKARSDAFVSSGPEWRAVAIEEAKLISPFGGLARHRRERFVAGDIIF